MKGCAGEQNPGSWELKKKKKKITESFGMHFVIF